MFGTKVIIIALAALLRHRLDQTTRGLLQLLTQLLAIITDYCYFRVT